MKSKRGIYYNLESSEYEYRIDDFTFVFSSLLYLKLFDKNIKEYIEYEQNRINNKIKNEIDFKELILINRYKSIEKRGFLVYYKDKELKDYSFSLKLEMR